MNYVFIINPAAGKGKKADETAKTIREFFKNREDNIHIYLSKCPGDAIRFGKEYPIPDGEEVCFVACGGDGTFFETVNGAFGRPGASFSIYPCGSGNDFIKSSGGNPEDYLDLNKLVNGETQVFDALECNGKICSNICNIGLDSVIADRLNRYKKLPGVSGSMAYNLSTAFTVGGGIFGGLAKPMKITFDDGEVFEKRLMFSVFGNGKVYGGGYHAVPEAKLDDGLIDFCAVSEIGVLRIAKVINIYKRGDHIDDPNLADILTMRRCTGAKIESPELLTVSVDGEIFKSKEIEVKMIPSSLPFRIPKTD
ncbi:MAG: diacylglycerol kinase family lipid kinase [Oscillospiraceae bacterium]|nr:diacylglycerol kinase family lipid kinase [Oscillospiraceae bacterium]